MAKKMTTAVHKAVARWKSKIFWRAAAIFICSSVFFSNSPLAAQGEGDATFRSGVNMVLADVSVVDKEGVPVSSLMRDQFEVKENGKTRPLSRFEEGTAKVSLALVVDYSGSMYRRRDAVLRGVRALIAQLQPGDEAALLVFNEHVSVLKTFQSQFQLEDWTSPLANRKPTGQTALYDAILQASRLLETSAHERRVIVVLSDGKDTASTASRDITLDEMRSSNRLLYTVGLFEPGEPETDALSLRKLSEATGGNTIFDPEGMQLAETFTAIMKDLRARYFLGFYVEAPATDKPEVRRISISVRPTTGGSPLRVRARREYRIAGH